MATLESDGRARLYQTFADPVTKVLYISLEDLSRVTAPPNRHMRYLSYAKGSYVLPLTRLFNVPVKGLDTQTHALAPALA